MWKIVVTRPRRLIGLVLVLAGLVLMAVGSWLWEGTVILNDGEFNIAEGSYARQVWARLAQEGYVKNMWPAYYYGWKLKAANNLNSGLYRLQAGESVAAVIKRFVAGGTNSGEITITFPEGFTLSQIAARSEARGIGQAQEFIDEAKPEKYSRQFPWLKDVHPPRNLEGYLFPDTYRVFVDDEPRDIIGRMLANFSDKFSDQLRQEALARGRTIDQIVIMASIIEREVSDDKEMALVSGILWRRLDDGVGLDVDATVRYALDKWNEPLTVQDLDNESPYNTRKWRGLPPGPISNPGRRSIIAAVRPAESDYYYYLSTPAGRTVFAKTLTEHNQNKVRYL